MPWSNQPGGPWGSGSRGPWGSGPQSQGPRPPDLEEFLRRGQDRLRGLMPGNLGGRGIALIALVLIALWGLSGFFSVKTDEIGVVLRFGQFVREAQPGLNYHLPYPIETALTPQALRINKIDIGFDTHRGSTMRDVLEESLMLTGDKNIVDVEFSVFWLVKPSSIGDYLFSVVSPGSTVKAVAESAMREVIGRSDVQPLLAGFRQSRDSSTPAGDVVQNVGAAVQDLMQKTLDSYKAGILIRGVQLQKIDPPAEVNDSFLDVQAAQSDLERAQNEAQTYANRVVPEARGRAAKIIQDAEAYREQTVADAKGQTSRFSQVYEQYKKAPDVTRERMYLETMERVLGGTDKTIIDTGRQSPGVVPYLPLTELPRARTAPQQPSGGGQ